MKLDIFEYVYNQGQPSEWRVEECKLMPTNLIVGKNASGKSRIVTAIRIISELLSTSGKINPNSRTDEWFLHFDIDRPERTEYILKIDKGSVIKEQLTIADKKLLDRDESGEGTIFAQELNQNIRFQTPKTELAVTKRRDAIQHPFLENLYQWANSLRLYEFGSQLGKDIPHWIPPTIESLKNETNFKNSDHVVRVFILGQKEIGDDFIQAIISDMKKINYHISDIGTEVLSLTNSDISFPVNLDNQPEFLYVQEQDLKSITDQLLISQGMFRALSLFIQINYSLLLGKLSCIVIDDIGEGLDYERSAAIIKVLIEKAQTGLVQLIMTTNDEFIMNGVPLEYWSVIERKPGRAKLHNMANSEDKFKQFQFIGLNNFDFFTSEFVLQEELDVEEE